MGRERPRVQPSGSRDRSTDRGSHRLGWRLSLRSAIGAVVTFVWAVSFLADIFLPDYDPDATIHIVMMVVAGGFFGQEIVRKVQNGDG